MVCVMLQNSMPLGHIHSQDVGLRYSKSWALFSFLLEDRCVVFFFLLSPLQPCCVNALPPLKWMGGQHFFTQSWCRSERSLKVEWVFLGDTVLIYRSHTMKTDMCFSLLHMPLVKNSIRYSSLPHNIMLKLWCVCRWQYSQYFYR